MALFGGVRRNRTRLLGKSKVRVTRCIGFEHRGVARECGCNPKVLLLPVDIGHSMSGFGSD